MIFGKYAKDQRGSMSRCDESKERAKEYVLKLAKEHEVKSINMWFSDILGVKLRFSPAMTADRRSNSMGKLLIKLRN